MAANYVIERSQQGGLARTLYFAGDGVRLAGQIDYPFSAPDYTGTFPLLFTLHYAGCHPLDRYAHYADIGLNNGYTVFRWDKRGSGRSGSGGKGSTTQDAVNAYETALDQQGVDPRRAVILAPAEGGVLLAESYGLFARLNPPKGVILAGNMLDPHKILAIDAPVLVISGEKDWLDWNIYGQQAAQAHAATYNHGSRFVLAKGANRFLMYDHRGEPTFHMDAKRAIESWLASL
jgi:uncharacterized protein